MNNLTLTPYLLPTEDASHLYIVKNRLYFDVREVNSLKAVPCQHLYLCSSEEIKEGDFVYDDNKKLIEKVTNKTYLPHYNSKKKIILTTDPKLTANGVLPIDGNTMIIVKDLGDDIVEKAFFLEEFCKRWNDKDKEVDVDLVHRYCKENSINGVDYKIVKKNYTDGLKDGYKTNVGSFSLEDMRKAHSLGESKGLFYDDSDQLEKLQTFDNFIKSLTPQSKGEIIIEVEMETWLKVGYGTGKISQYKIKLTDGQPILTFK